MENGSGPVSQRKFAMLRTWNYVLGALNVVFVAIIGIIVYRSNWLAPAPNPQRPLELVLSILNHQQQTASTSSPIEYKDFISIILTALSAMIAVLGLVLAGAAIWGYQELKGAALRAALEQVEKLVPPIASRAAENVARQQMAGGLNDSNSDYGAAAGREGGHDQQPGQNPPADGGH